MKFLLLLLLLSSNIVFSQCDTTNAVNFPDVDAHFPGGKNALLKFVQSNIEYPEIERYQCHQPRGRVYLQFIVCEDGSIHNLSILRSSGNDEIDQIGLNLIKKMPNWIPGKVSDLPVSSLVRFPVQIDLF